MIRLNKNQLNALGTVLGIIAGIATVLNTQGIGDKKTSGAIAGIATVCLGYVVQKPATEEPTTEQVEKQEVSDEPRKS